MKKLKGTVILIWICIVGFGLAEEGMYPLSGIHKLDLQKEE